MYRPASLRKLAFVLLLLSFVMAGCAEQKPTGTAASPAVSAASPAVPAASAQKKAGPVYKGIIGDVSKKAKTISINVGPEGKTESMLVLLKVQAGSEPEYLGVSVGGIAVSAGYNAAKISLTGNQLDSNDVRPGVPRLLIVRAILGSRTLSEAMTHCLLPTRASSYNNVLADGSGEVYSMEGSATDLEAIYIADDVMAHANHYVAPSMRRFERDRGVIANSIIRHNRADYLLRQNYGKLTPELFRTLLADHAGYPTSICKHGLESQTVFSIIVQVETLKSWIGRGHACETEYIEYQLQPYQR